ncbi:MAG: hypothetical protein PF541_15965 [Prolixibacteraceae bacterium]|jgi:flavodoxin|nr:hypothetical protein [Prolixibacteraceae bacterium]
MKTLLLFDSYFGNTEKIARAIAEAFIAESDFVIKRSSDVTANELYD